MNRAKLLRFSLRLANSLSSTQQPGFHFHRLNQVTQFSSFLSQFQQTFSLIRKPIFSYNNSPISQKNLNSNCDSYVQIILSNDWSNEIENELEEMNPKITHEFVVYVLTKLNENPQKSLDFFKWVCDKKGFNPSHLPYTLLLRTLACKDFVKEFWVIALEMKDKGIYFDKQFCVKISLLLKHDKLDETLEEWKKFYKSISRFEDRDDVAKDVVEVILGADWSEEVESKLKKLEFELSDNVLFWIIWSLKDQPLKAMKFFEWVADYRKHEHNSVTYSGIARVLARGGLTDEFWDLLTRMRSVGVEIDSLAKVFRFLKHEDAVRLFEFMMDGPYKLSEQECVSLLKSLAHVSDPDTDLVNRVVYKYVEAGNGLTKSIYYCIHRSLCKVGKFDEAKKIVEDMTKVGYKPDNITFSQEMFGLCKVRRFEDACQLLDRMETQGCIPDIKTWTILMQGYCTADQVDQALSCFARMLEKNIEPDADMLEVLLNGLISNNKLLVAYDFLVEMVNKYGLKPCPGIYESMIHKLLEDKELEKASSLVRMMKEQGYPPYAKPIFIYISKSGNVEDAKKLLEALSVAENSPSVAVHVNAISYFFEEGRYTEAKDLLYASPPKVRNHKKIKTMFGSEQESNDKSLASNRLKKPLSSAFL